MPIRQCFFDINVLIKHNFDIYNAVVSKFDLYYWVDLLASSLVVRNVLKLKLEYKLESCIMTDRAFSWSFHSFATLYFYESTI